jgi:membrane protein implicated in regulation of membrane protease activity
MRKFDPVAFAVMIGAAAVAGLGLLWLFPGENDYLLLFLAGALVPLIARPVLSGRERRQRESRRP